MHEHNQSGGVGVNVRECSLPTVIPDVDKDAVSDLIVPCLSLVASQRIPLFLLISGMTGQLIGHPVPILPCKTKPQIILHQNIVQYQCHGK